MERSGHTLWQPSAGAQRSIAGVFITNGSGLVQKTLPLIELISCLLNTYGNSYKAHARAIYRNADERVIAALKDFPAESVIAKTVVPAETTSNESALVALQSLQSEWFATLRSQSLLDALLSESRSIPIGARYAISSAVLAGVVGTEASWTPISKGSFTAGAAMTPLYALARSVVTEELVRFASPAGLALLDQEMRRAVSRAGDGPVLTALLDGLTPIASAGDFRTDLQAAFDALSLDQGSRPMIFSTPDIIKKAALLGGDSGPAFPDLAIPGGGSIANCACLGIDACHTGGADGDLLIVVDAARTGGSAGALDIRASRNATIQMTDNASGVGSSSPANTVSAFQDDFVVLLAARYFNFSKSSVADAACIKNIVTV